MTNVSIFCVFYGRQIMAYRRREKDRIIAETERRKMAIAEKVRQFQNRRELGITARYRS